MAIASSWLTIDDDELKVQLSSDVLMQVEADIADLTNHDRSTIIYKLDSELLLPVLASGFGISKSSFTAKGAIVVWTYYYDKALGAEPIVRTLLTLDGDLSQKVSQQLLQHPIAERIISVHSFLIGQISQQIVTVITEYIYLQLQPYILGISTYAATRLYFCDPIRAVVNSLANSSRLPIELQTAISHLSDCNTLAIALTVLALVIWWIVVKSPLAIIFKPSQTYRLPKNGSIVLLLSWVQSFIKSLNKLSIRLFKKSLKQLGAEFLEALDSRLWQILAIALILVLGISWLLQWQGGLINPQQRESIYKLTNALEPYLPVAIVGVRKKIMAGLGNVCFSNPMFSKVFIKLFFGRFVTVR